MTIGRAPRISTLAARSTACVSWAEADRATSSRFSRERGPTPVAATPLANWLRISEIAVAGSGFELLHELCDGDGDAIPLIVFAPPDASHSLTAQVGAALLKSRTSIDNLVATLRRRVAGRSSAAPPNKDAA